jgi:AcrR family transcriptional regulator
MSDTIKWIKAGYKLFAENGINGLKVELVAKEVGISKSSFYHHFTDMELFIDRLLEHHINQYKIISKREYECKSLNPDLIKIFIEFKTDLLFNRQLRVNRNDKRFAGCLKKTDLIVGPSIMRVLKKELDPDLSQKLFDKLFPLVREAFYLQIDINALNEEWLPAYFSSVKDIVIGLGSVAKSA